jgi:hypothetical protein
VPDYVKIYDANQTYRAVSYEATGKRYEHINCRVTSVSEMEDSAAIYPEPTGFVNSSAAARVYGYLGGSGTLAQFEAEIDELGLSAEARQYLEKIAQRRLH